MNKTIAFMTAAGIMMALAACIDNPVSDDSSTDADNTAAGTIVRTWQVDSLRLYRTSTAVNPTNGDTVLVQVTDTVITGSGTADTMVITSSSLTYGGSTYSLIIDGQHLDIGDYFLQGAGISVTVPAEYSVHYFRDGTVELRLEKAYSIMEPISSYDVTKVLEKYDFVLSLPE